MKMIRPRIYSIRLLTCITALMLCGIIALQVYWLVTSYRQQRSRFTADMENALMATFVRSQLVFDIPVPVAPGVADTITGAQLEALMSRNVVTNTHIARSMTVISKTGNGPVRQIRSSDDRTLVNGQPVPSMPAYASIEDSLLTADGRSRFLGRFRASLRDELAGRAIHVPVELAMIERNGAILAATCDTAAFKRAPLQSAGTYTGMLNDVRLRAAFPDANSWLLRRMFWLLLVSIVLIAAVAFSFSYLVWQFFRQKRMADIRNDFMNNMTHELKTPISSVSVAIELMRDRRYPLAEAAREEYLDIAQRELKRLHLLVEKVLKMAAFERSDIHITPASFPAAAWIEEVTGSFRPMTDAAGARVTLEVQPLHLHLRADRMHLTNVLQNLLENALKYNDKPQPLIRISIREMIGCVQLEVTDNGKGIPAAYLGKIFDKFFRVPTGDRHDQKGYGLGLSYVQAVVALHEGTIAVQSKEGQGSTFIIQLPVKATN